MGGSKLFIFEKAPTWEPGNFPLYFSDFLQGHGPGKTRKK
jgi:hypothetical protein